MKVLISFVFPIFLLACGGSGTTRSGGEAPADTSKTGADATVDTKGNTPDVKIQDVGPEPDTQSRALDVTKPEPELPPTPVFPEAPAELGGKRPAKYKLPADYDPAKKWPLVLVLHGYGANLGQPNLSAGRIQDAYLGLSARSTELGFIALIPHGTSDFQGNQFWNATPACCDFVQSGVDDVGYLLGLLDEAAKYFNVDAKRVYLIGHSNGGFMSYRMACEAGDRFAALVCIAGSTFWKGTDCKPGGSQLSVLQVHGTLDTTIPYKGKTGHYPSAGDTAKRWAQRNGCTLPPKDGESLDIVNGENGSETTVKTFMGCDQGTSVELWSLQKVGHIPKFSKNFSAQALNFLLSKSRP